jgi:hypothetical protein
LTIRRQVVQLGRLLLFLFLLDRGADRIPASGLHRLRILRGGKSLRNRLGSVQIQPHMMVFLLLEHRDFPVSLRQHCQGGRLDTAHIQGTVIENGEQPGGVDAHQPIRFLTAKRRLIQSLILGAGA